MTDHDLFIPAEALREIDLQTLAGWNAVAFEGGRTAFKPEGIDVIDPAAPIVAYAAYALDADPAGGNLGLEGVAADGWLLVVCWVRERGGEHRGRVLEVRASAFQSQPSAAPSPTVMFALYDGAERYVAKRAANGMPVGVSLYRVRGEAG